MLKEKMEQKNLKIPEEFSAGFGREIVNPEPGTGIGGWGNAGTRLSDAIVDDLMVTCTAVCDGESIALIYSSDTLYVGSEAVKKVAAHVWDNYGIPSENLILNATHTHCAPSVHWNNNFPGVAAYIEKYHAALLRITDEAIADLAPATVLAGRTDTFGMNYVRRYISKHDGSYLGNWPPFQDPRDAYHETQPDTKMQVLRFVREEKKDIVLCNWQCHPCSNNLAGEKRTDISSDFIGPFRAWAEETMGILFSYQQGACGNLVSTTHILTEKSNENYKRKGKELCVFMKRALDCAVPVKTGKIRAKKEIFTAKRSRAWMERNSAKVEEENLSLTTLSFGDVAFATAPAEWHDTCGRSVREGSPFKMTFVCAYSNGMVSYIPAAFCWENGGYEVKMCHFERGTGEKIAVALTTSLIEHYKAEKEL